MRAHGLSGLLCAGLIALSAAAMANPGDVVYVDQRNTSGTEDGASWATAFSTLQPGIDAAWKKFGGEVWVAKGVYAENRENNGGILLRFGVSIYGGFAGTEVVRDQRVVADNETVIDGSTSNAGQPTAGVVLGSNSATLDGVTIRGGRAMSANTSQNGAGFVNVGVSPTIQNCLFIDNEAQRYGGGMLNVGLASPHVIDCVFNNNRAGESGGAVANTQASPIFTGCRFEGNAAQTAGGAIFNTPDANPEVTQCLFADNTAVKGGGAIFNESASPLIQQSKFLRNRCQQYGGAIFNDSTSRPLIINTIFIANVATDEGSGGLLGSQVRGGAIANLDSDMTAINCTFSKNDASGSAGAMFSINQSPTLINCIMYNDTPNEIASSSAFPAISYCDIQGGATGTGNIDIDPIFTNPDDFENGYGLQPDSSAINAGSATAAPTVDIDGTARPQGVAVDIGAYEATDIGTPMPFSCKGVTISFKSGPQHPAGDLLVQGGFLAMMAIAALRRRRQS